MKKKKAVLGKKLFFDKDVISTLNASEVLGGSNINCTPTIAASCQGSCLLVCTGFPVCVSNPEPTSPCKCL